MQRSLGTHTEAAPALRENLVPGGRKVEAGSGVIRQHLNKYQTCRKDGGAGKRMLADMSKGFRVNFSLSPPDSSIPQASWAGQSEHGHVLRYGKHDRGRNQFQLGPMTG